jgi:hypothetical protein
MTAAPGHLTFHVTERYRQYVVWLGSMPAQASGDGLRFAMLIMLTANLLSVIYYLRAARTFRKDLHS